LKPCGTIIMNTFRVVPPAVKTEDYPTLDKIKEMIKDYFASGGQGGMRFAHSALRAAPAKAFDYLITIDANEIAHRIGDKAGRSANAVVLGLLSTIKPFDAIPLGTWISALMAVSRKDLEKSLNYKALKAGREYRQKDSQ